MQIKYMKLAIKCVHFIMLVGVVLVGFPANAADGTLINTDLCSVISQPDQYKDKTIRLRAMVLVSRDRTLLAPDSQSSNVIELNIPYDAAKDLSVEKFLHRAYVDVSGHDPPIVDFMGVLRIDSNTHYKAVVDLRYVYAFSITPAGTRRKAFKLCKMPKPK